MSIKVITEFVNKTTVRVIAYIYDDAGALVDPLNSIKVTITDPDGTPVADGVEIKTTGYVSKGIYEHYQTTTAAYVKGYYKGEIWVIDGEGDGAKTSYGDFSFKVK